MRPVGWGDTATPKIMGDLRTMLGGGLTFKDNINCAIINVDAQHAVETKIANPLLTKPIAFIPIGALSITAIGGQSSNVARVIDGQPVLNTSRTDGYLGLTVRYQHGYSVVESFTAFASSVTLSTGTPADVVSVSVGPGTWDLAAMPGFYGNGGAPTGTALYACLAVNSATLNGIPGYSLGESPTMPTSVASVYTVIPSLRVTVSTTTTYYLVAQATFSAGTIRAFGRVTALPVAPAAATLGRVTGILVGA